MDSTVYINGHLYKVDLGSPNDISIPLNFSDQQLNYFNVPKAISTSFRDGNIVGNTKAGGGCNFDTISLIPHCSTTHTECVGHIVDEKVCVNQFDLNKLKAAVLISVKPEIGLDNSEIKPNFYSPRDKTISGKLIGKKIKNKSVPAEVLIVRTLPNPDEKIIMNYDGANIPPYFTVSAVEEIKKAGFKHLCIDIPSLDRALDGGELASHHSFWDIPLNAHTISEDEPSQSTITELIFVPDKIKHGTYLINLQVANISSDAAPSRPVLFSITA